MVLQAIEGSTGLIALSVGTHDHVDSFLDGHKGYIFDPKTGTLKELRLATADETTVEVVPSRTLVSQRTSETANQAAQKLFRDFSDEMLIGLNVHPTVLGRIRGLKILTG